MNQPTPATDDAAPPGALATSPLHVTAVAAVAWVACCIGPVLGVLGTIAALRMACTILIGAAGLLIVVARHR